MAHHRRGGRRALLVILMLAWPLAAAAQQKPLTLDDLYDPQKRVDFVGTVPTGLVWLDDQRYLQVRGGGGGPRGGGQAGPSAQAGPVEWLIIDAATGQATPFLDVGKLEAALGAIPGVSAADAKRLASRRSFLSDQPRPNTPLSGSDGGPAAALNPSKTALLMRIGDDLYHYDLKTAALVRLTAAPGYEEDPAFSPDGRMVGFTRDGNLFVVDVATQRERQVTSDGGAQRLNGRLDWVYQEEIYGRGSFRAFWWSPDSTRLAFLQLDQHPVPEFTLTDHISPRQALEVFDYPKAGDPNPFVKLGVVRAAGGPVQWIDTSKYSAADHLIVNVGWAPSGQEVVFSLQDREQTWLDLNLGHASTGTTRTLFRETTKAWVDNQGDPTWLKDGSFLWTSERTGWKHVYHYGADGKLQRALTGGPWEARTLYGVDEASGWVYFAGTERSHIGSDVYRVKLDGSGLSRLTQTPGTHAANFNPGMTAWIGTWSDVTTPPQTRLHRADGVEVRVIEQNTVAALSEYRLSKPEFVQVKTRDGFVMEALLIKPPDFDPSKKYPVFQQTYAGPHAPQVANRWAGLNAMFNQFLAQQGIVVWICDNRSASGKGAESAWHAYKRLGESELADIEDGIAWLKQQPWVDATRIGLNGWSYGGFMTSYALTHSKSFAMGIAGGSVTDWHLYDSIYTERFMLMPQNNPEGYERTSVVKAAKNLSGRLLLIHGLLDDNVHAQNTVQLAYELQRAGKPFELMLYPKSRHGVTDPMLVRHMRQTMVDFIVRTLRPAGAQTAKGRTTAAAQP
jgi:dipeptidyl-peptidase-4